MDLGGLQLNCRYFNPGEIEFDLDPKQFNETRFNALQDFLASVGRRLKRDVLLTPENRSHDPIVKLRLKARSDRQGGGRIQAAGLMRYIIGVRIGSFPHPFTRAASTTRLPQ